MSGRKNKKLRRQIKEDKIQKRIELRKLAELPSIPAPKIAEFLVSKFVGKTGYHYISIGKPGSLFLNKVYESIVPIMLHNSFPIMSATGRFNDANKKDCAIGLVKVKPDFPGLVVDRHLNLYLNGCSIIVKDEDALPQLCDLERVTVSECNDAIKSQEEIFSEKMNSLVEAFKERERKLNEVMSDPYSDPYNDPYLDKSAIKEDMTEYLVNDNKVEVVK
jgi:hypothetical protein